MTKEEHEQPEERKPGVVERFRDKFRKKVEAFRAGRTDAEGKRIPYSQTLETESLEPLESQIPKDKRWVSLIEVLQGCDVGKPVKVYWLKGQVEDHQSLEDAGTTPAEFPKKWQEQAAGLSFIQAMRLPSGNPMRGFVMKRAEDLFGKIEEEAEVEEFTFDQVEKFRDKETKKTIKAAKRMVEGIPQGQKILERAVDEAWKPQEYVRFLRHLWEMAKDAEGKFPDLDDALLSFRDKERERLDVGKEETVGLAVPFGDPRLLKIGEGLPKEMQAELQEFYERLLGEKSGLAAAHEAGILGTVVFFRDGNFAVFSAEEQQTTEGPSSRSFEHIFLNDDNELLFEPDLNSSQIVEKLGEMAASRPTLERFDKTRAGWTDEDLRTMRDYIIGDRPVTEADKQILRERGIIGLGYSVDLRLVFSFLKKLAELKDKARHDSERTTSKRITKAIEDIFA